MSAFLPWIRVLGISVSGINGDGQITLVLAVIGLLLVFLGRRITLRVQAVAQLLLGGLVALIGLYDMNSFAAIGLYLTLLGGVAWTIAAVMMLRARPKPSPESVGHAVAEPTVDGDGGQALGLRPCSECGCEEFVGRGSDRFCARCGHSAEQHAGDAVASAAPTGGCSECDCAGFYGADEDGFCGRCGHSRGHHGNPVFNDEPGVRLPSPATAAVAWADPCQRCDCAGFVGEIYCANCGHHRDDHGSVSVVGQEPQDALRLPAVEPSQAEQPASGAPPEPPNEPVAVPASLAPLAPAKESAARSASMPSGRWLGAAALIAVVILVPLSVWLLSRGGSSSATPAPATAPSGTPLSSAPSSESIPPTTPPSRTVQKVVDGVTLQMADGTKVHLAQVDAPNLDQCYGSDAKQALAALVPAGSVVHLRPEPRLRPVDQSGRLVRYVTLNGHSIGLALIEAGAANAYFLNGVEGTNAAALYKAAIKARKQHTGMWSTCPSYRLYPFAQVGRNPS